MDNSRIENLIARKLTGNISSDEASELQAWLKASSENKALYKEYTEMWQSFVSKKPNYIPDAHSELYKIKQQLNILPEQKQASIYSINDKKQIQAKYTTILTKFRIYAVAASILLMLTCGYLAKLYLFSDTMIKTAYAELKQVILPDSSVIQLNSGSKLSYNDNFNNETRVVSLSGEAFFEVKKSNIPFIVKTENASVRVVGTKFNVNSRNNKTKVIVQEGTVALLSNAYLNDELILKANEMSLCANIEAPVPVRKINADKLLGWLHGTLVFDEATIYEVAEELERTYDVEIDVAIHKFPETISGSFKNKSIENVLEAVCIALGLNHVKRNDKYIILL